jgi:hypothetical protein
MRSFLIGFVIVAVAAWTVRPAQAQPSAAAVPPQISTTLPSSAAAPTPAVAEPVDRSRYRYQDGRWWYLLPDNRWVYWENGAWVNYTPPAVGAPVPAYQYVQPPPYGYYAYPGYYDPAYYGGYYGGPAVSVGLGGWVGGGWGWHGHR